MHADEGNVSRRVNNSVSMTCNRFIDPDNHRLGMEPCTEFEYVLEEGEWTVTTEYDLVCSKAYLPPLMSSLYFVGTMSGNTFFGDLADRFGRKPPILIGMWVLTALGISLVFVKNLILYILIKIISGALSDGIFVTSVTLLMEYAPLRLRGQVAVAHSLFWGVGLLLLGAITYSFRDWRQAQLAISLPFVLSCVYLWFLPESIRWLLATDRTEEARKTIHRIHRIAGIEESPELDKEIEDLQRSVKKSMVKDNKYSYLDLIRTPELRRRVLIMVTIYFSMGMCYTGILLNVGELSGNKYINFLAGGGLELVSYSITIGLVGKLKRKTTFLGTAMLGGITAIIGVVLKHYGGTETLSLISSVFILVSKSAVTGSFAVTKGYISELVPTVVRNMGISACFISIAIANLITPQVVYLGVFTDPIVPFVIFTVLLLFGGGLGVFLPETKDTIIPETIEDVEMSVMKLPVPDASIRTSSML